MTDCTLMWIPWTAFHGINRREEISFPELNRPSEAWSYLEPWKDFTRKDHLDAWFPITAYRS
jgi:hypothetical protein